MPRLDIALNLDENPWTDLHEKDQARGASQRISPTAVRLPVIERIGLLPNGMDSGRATVAIVMRLADGTFVLAEQSLRNFRIGALAILATPTAIAEDDYTGSTLATDPEAGTGELLLGD